MKFDIDIQIGDAILILEGEMDEEGAEVDAIYHNGEEISELLSSVINITGAGNNGWTKLHNHLAEYAHERYHQLAAEEKIARAEYEWELRTDR